MARAVDAGCDPRLTGPPNLSIWRGVLQGLATSDAPKMGPENRPREPAERTGLEKWRGKTPQKPERPEEHGGPGDQDMPSRHDASVWLLAMSLGPVPLATSLTLRDADARCTPESLFLTRDC